MYCGKNKTACSSQAMIAQTLLALMQQKAYDQISVSELCRDAGISRQTFYSLFSSKENVVTFLLRKQYYEEPTLPDRSSDCFHQLCLEYCRYIVNHSPFIRILVDNHIDYLLYSSIYDSLAGCTAFFQDIDPPRRGFTAHFLAGGFTSIAKSYIQENCSLNIQQLYDICVTLFEGKIL
ncbi:MAG: TetR family transcriptional regulator [Blautia sp.]|nr:TetR family transcriptional regulator [Blautia sp.]